MTTDAVTALEAERDRAMAVFRSLTHEQWQAASGCTGWRVQDVACHMASVFHQIADPTSIEGGTSEDVEENAEVPVQARHDWTSEQVLADYEEWADKGLVALAGLQEPPMAEMTVPLANLGSHPLHLLANALAFDHYCHLRHDIGAAVPEAAALPRDEVVLGATMTWMMAGLPQMCAAGLGPVVDQPVNLVFEGPGGGSWVLRPASEEGGFVVVDEGLDPGPAATVTSTAHDFVSWGTQRADWRASGMTVDGDADYAARVLGAFNVI